MKYYFVEDFKNQTKYKTKFNPTEDIIENYSDCNMISLNRKPLKYWPKEVETKPEIVMTIRSELVEIGEYSDCPELIISEHDYNGTMMFKTTISSEKYHKKQSKCIKHVIRKFHERIKKSSIGICSNERIICEECKTMKVKAEDIEQTNLTRDSLKLILQSSSINKIEGIYKSIDVIGAYYEIAILSRNGEYQIIVLDSSLENWVQGHKKGTFKFGFDAEDFQINWITGNNFVSKPLANFNEEGILKVKFNEEWFKKDKYFIKVK